MIKKIGKRAQSHVEIMLSFVLFMGALILIFMFINPFSKADEQISVIDNVQKALINQTSMEIGKLSIITEDEAYCFSDIFLTYAPNKEDGCSDPYTAGVYLKENMIVWAKIENLVSNYNTDYSGLKSSLNILNDFSFSFKNIAGDEEVVLTPTSKTPPIGVNVEAKEFPVRVIDSSANIHELILNIRVW